MSDLIPSLASGFDIPSYGDWQALVENSLKGKPLDPVLQQNIADGVTLSTLGVMGANPAEQPNARAGHWDICTPHWDCDATSVNKAILADLEGGAHSVALRMEAGLFPGLKPADLERALQGVYLDLAPIRLMSGDQFEAGARALMELAENAGLLADLRGTAGADPIGTLAQNGRLEHTYSETLQSAAQLAKEVSDKAPGFAAFSVDAGVFHSAGADAVDELAMTLCAGLSYLRAMEQAGLDPKDAAPQIEFRLVAGADFFTTIAKIRAFKRLWAGILNASDAGTVTSRVGGVMSLRMLTVKDPWVNILRATVAGFGAAVGGADLVTLVPHDTLYGVPSDFGRRIARNISVILQEESQIGAVSDPAAGAYSIETMTESLTHEAWSRFQTFEGDGGLYELLKTGKLAQFLAGRWQKREKALASRKISVTGVSEFPDLNEKSLDHTGPQYAPRSDLPTAGEEIIPLPFHRDAEAFERLRVESDQLAAETGERPTVQLVTFGALSNHLARLTFTQNLLASVGLANQVVAAADLPDEMNASPLVILVAGDSDYDETILNVAAKLASKGPAFITLAGRPKNMDHFLALGLESPITLGMNVVELGKELLTRWRIHNG